MEDTNCIFCKIIRGELPALKVYENDTLIAFLDIQPVNKGHTLIIPKKHYRNLYNLPDEILGKIGILMRDLAIAIKKAVGAEGINIEMNNESLAGQLVDHAHIHIIPRFLNDGLRHWPGKELPSDEMKKTREVIVSLIKKNT